MSHRPQDKNIEPYQFQKLPVEQRKAIQSAGGKKHAENCKRRKAMAEILEVYSGLPIKDGRVRKRLINLGVDPEDLTQKTLVADGIMKAAQKGNSFAIQLFLDLIGEGNPEVKKDNNLLDAITESTQKDIETDDLPEVQQETEPDADVVEQAEV